MANLRSAVTAILLLAGCTAMQAPGHSPHSAGAESISFQLNSWGYPVEGFTIAGDGSGEFRKAPEFRAQPQVTRFNAGRSGFERICAALGPIERFRGREVPCGQRATDLPYGDIVWQTGPRRTIVSLNVGCQSAEMQGVVARAQEATRLAQGFARSNPAR